MGRAEYEVRYEKHLRAVGIAVEILERESDGSKLGDVTLDSIRVNLDADEGTSVLAIVKGHNGAGQVIGFVGAADLPTCLIAVAKRVAKGSVKWREDKPWGE